MSSCSRKGDQLVLSLDDVRVRRVVIPWDGRSPRALTRAARALIFEAQAGKRHERHEIDRQQLDLFEKRGPSYAGAPSLLPLPQLKEVNHGSRK